MIFPRRELFLVTALACATGAAAQGPRADQARTVFTPDRLARVGVDARRTEGRVASLADSQLVLRHGASVERIALADVDTVWTAKGEVVKGAVIGAVFGGVFLGLLAVVIDDSYCGPAAGCREARLPLFFEAGAMGAVGGAALGAVLGTIDRKWERAWP